MDYYFRMTIEESRTGQSLFKKGTLFALVAVGGYGRKELCLHSDIDILILFNKGIPPQAKELAEELFYPLWDLGMDLGYGVRTVKDCLSLSKDDFEVLTSLIDIRFICGASQLYLRLIEGLQKKVIKKSASSYVKWIYERNDIRMNTFGDASHLLEPNLKEGIGGLREYHHIMWMAKAFLNVREPEDLKDLGRLSDNELNDLQDSVKFILLVRNHLHQLSGRKNDRLNFEYQEKIANRLGYKNLPKFPAVEQFLSTLHSAMESVKNIHRSFLALHLPKRNMKVSIIPEDISKEILVSDNEIGFISSEVINTDPPIIMDIFEQSCRLGLPLSLEARRQIKEFLNLVDDPFRSSERTVSCFLKIINGRNTVETLDQMFETGLLDAFIPEFGMIRDRVQFDAYHIFPVGRHVLETVANLKSLSRQKDLLLFDIFVDIKNHEHLFLAGLFHDIGKTGKGHARRGSQICRNILKRIGYPEKWAEEISFLINHHLLLAETATRRDLNDEKVIIDTARLIGDIERLKALYLLTWADSKATGPRAWNEWTENLVQELFFKVLHILEGDELATPGSSKKVMKLRSTLKRRISGDIDQPDFDRLFDAMSPRYKLNTPPADILRNMEMVLSFEKEAVVQKSTAFILDVREDRYDGFWKITFIGKDRPGLFSDIAGVLALNNINILSANIYTWRNGTAVDIFSVTKPLDSIHPSETWEKIISQLKNIFSGRLSLSYRMSLKAYPSILSERKTPARPPEVRIDNRSSDFFTLVEVFASDRIGLLYLITRTLFDLQLDIRIAKIGVKGDQIADVFYVRDLDGQKIYDENHFNEIKDALLYHLSGKL
ncbi:MAG TPA: [protein-PII] uridylyltransferase [Desulfobacteraceae bacterium]|nr:[protein-PII] uridylyltransferase [Desulfobacteraceae bacterium]HPJ66758.1 [protein-PII] uridylyltransferase [Desulfobacteraceae bacterium]